MSFLDRAKKRQLKLPFSVTPTPATGGIHRTMSGAPGARSIVRKQCRAQPGLYYFLNAATPCIVVPAAPPWLSE